MWNEIIISNFNPHFTGHVISNPGWDKVELSRSSWWKAERAWTYFCSAETMTGAEWKLYSPEMFKSRYTALFSSGLEMLELRKTTLLSSGLYLSHPSIKSFETISKRHLGWRKVIQWHHHSKNHRMTGTDVCHTSTTYPMNYANPILISSILLCW